jgi:hypothetical protein
MSNNVNVPEKTAAKHRAALWQPGQSGNPLGRPKGSRNRLAEKLVADFCADWEQHGAAAIAWLRQHNKLHYVKIAAQLIPKEFVMKDQSINDLSDEQISEMLAYLADEMRGKQAKVIEGEVVEQKADKSGGLTVTLPFQRRAHLLLRRG